MAALIIAGDTSGAPAVLGHPLIEFQLRRARAAGAGHAVLLVERMPATLVASIDRLRREGLTIDIVRDVAGVADSIHPEERVLIVPVGVIAAPEWLATLIASDPPALLCVADKPENERYELIDPTARWSGFALLDGAFIRRTAGMLGEWDLAPTLMRRAVQDGAARLKLSEAEAATALTTVDGEPDARRVGRAVVAPRDGDGRGWGRRWIVGPAARLLARIAGEARVDADWLALSGSALTGVAALAAVFGWVRTAPLAFLIGLIVAGAGEVLSRAVGQPLRGRPVERQLRSVAGMIGMFAIGLTLAERTGQWGCGLLALVAAGAAALSLVLAGGDREARAWIGDEASYAAMLGAGALLGVPVFALALAAAHAAAGLAWLNLRIVRRAKQA